MHNLLTKDPEQEKLPGEKKTSACFTRKSLSTFMLCCAGRGVRVFDIAVMEAAPPLVGFPCDQLPAS